eukprot:6235613-Ditylum_brightwellii.AAC.1
MMRGQWPNVQSHVNRKRAIDDIVALKAEFKKKDKIIKSYKLANPLSSNKIASRHTIKDTKCVPKSVPNYHPKAQVGRGKDFATKADFYSWKHTPPKGGNIYCLPSVNPGEPMKSPPAGTPTLTPVACPPNKHMLLESSQQWRPH